jgi:hypothetical protein
MTKKPPQRSARGKKSKKSKAKTLPAVLRQETVESKPMKTMLALLEELADADLYALCEAVEVELQHREGMTDDISDSARRRALEREQSYRRRNGAGAPPIRIIGIGKATPRRRAA